MKYFYLTDFDGLGGSLHYMVCESADGRREFFNYPSRAKAEYAVANNQQLNYAVLREFCAKDSA